MTIKKITNCKECPFANVDNYVINYCNANDEIILNRFQELPDDTVHELCPLKNGIMVLKLNIKK